MITVKELPALLEQLNFTKNKEVYSKKYEQFDCFIQVNTKQGKITYPESSGLTINEKQTCNFSSNENFVVLECVDRLLTKGYHPKHIELEPKWKVGHGASGGRADILIKDNHEETLLIIECKNPGTEFNRHWKDTLDNGGQLFGYAQQERNANYLCLYASDIVDGKLKPHYYLITLQDNDEYLADHPELKPFRDAKDRTELFHVWNYTYQKNYASLGLFENEIQPYEIGKKKYTIEDLKNIDSESKQSKHHEFATILRKFNVSGRENAFDKLVNLFLCKIVDEKNNPDDLQFYWKGIAYDTPFELQDRLQKLYKIGMDEFLQEDVTYIDSDQIDRAFWTFENDPDSTRETIKDYFKQLKFFTNNDFAFIDVHNERLFYENAEVLIEIVKLFQDTKIKGSKKNQFLGDMFENFLDGGVKQSEGQFFTPMPITRFIAMSLPLEEQIIANSSIPKVIDYACGSGHFLNEIASQMRAYVARKEGTIEEYYNEIYGIEKEYRLSKVAKVSAFMYGQDSIKIKYADALSETSETPEDSYSILLANPPYSVKGFLTTLSEKERANYTLSSTVDSKSFETNNSIECFFIERAKQLLKPGGVAAIIVPTSILSNADSTYEKTRAILLEHFEIVSLAEFGPGTFGKTGTNTVILYLRRRKERPEPASHYTNRINDWFTGVHKKDFIFEDFHYVEKYCAFQQLNLDDYKEFMLGKINTSLQANELFKGYQEAFNASSSLSTRKKQSSYKQLSDEEKKQNLEQLFSVYCHSIEKKKLLYFMLSLNNGGKVFISRAPSDSKQSKAFLGYEWSSAKGSEGIKIKRDSNGKHITPLYDAGNRDNPKKINYFIEEAFNGNEHIIPEELSSIAHYSNVHQMIDFRSADFNLSISLAPSEDLDLITKWPTQPLSALLRRIKGATTKIQKKEIQKEGKHPVITQEKEQLISGYSDNDNVVTDLPLVVFGDHSCTVKYVDFEFLRGADGTQLLALKDEQLSMKYLYHLLRIIPVQNRNKYERHFKYLQKAKIPIPDHKTQQRIIEECNQIDSVVEQSTKAIKENLKRMIALSTSGGFGTKNLSSILQKQSNSVNPAEMNGAVNYIGLENIESGTGNLVGTIAANYNDIKSNKMAFTKGQILYGKLRPNLNKIYLAEMDGICSTDILVLDSGDKVLNQFYAKYLLSKEFNQQVLRTVSGQQLPRTSWDKMSSLKVQAPDKVEIETITKDIAKIHEDNKKNTALIQSSPAKLNETILKHL